MTGINILILPFCLNCSAGNVSNIADAFSRGLSNTKRSEIFAFGEIVTVPSILPSIVLLKPKFTGRYSLPRLSSNFRLENNVKTNGQ